MSQIDFIFQIDNTQKNFSLFIPFISLWDIKIMVQYLSKIQ